MTISTLQSDFRRITSELGVKALLRTSPGHDGSAHVEYDGHLYYYVVTERGTEVNRIETSEKDQILFLLIRDVTRDIALRWEMENRIEGQDFRRLLFQRHLELLQSIDAKWALNQREYYSEVLAKNPYDDASGNRVRFFKQAQEQGLSNEAAWEKALSKYPLPVAT